VGASVERFASNLEAQPLSGDCRVGGRRHADSQMLDSDFADLPADLAGNRTKPDRTKYPQLRQHLHSL
jgi:hypothetical protein